MEDDEYEDLKRKYVQREDLRFRFLCGIFQLQFESDFDERVKIPLKDVGEIVGLNDRESHKLFRSMTKKYNQEGLVAPNRHYNYKDHEYDDDYPYVVLTPKGMAIVKEGLGLNDKPKKELSVVTQYNISNSSVAIESPGTTQSYSVVHQIPEDLFDILRDIRKFVEQNNLDNSDSEAVQGSLNEIEKEVQSDSPNKKNNSREITYN